MRKAIWTLWCVVAMFSCSKIPIESLDIEKYKELTNYADGTITSFLFFTDPHLNEDNAIFNHYMWSLESVYKSVPLEFCMCGGDWLNSGDTNMQASDKLQFIDDYMYRIFQDNYYSILGNHDTNYQGRLNEESPIASGNLEYESIVNLLFDKHGSSYYTFESNASRFFIFDTGLDWYPQMNDFRWEQLHWYAMELSDNIDENIVIAMHIYTNDLKNPADFSRKIMEISEAYNNRAKILLEDSWYDFSEAIGHVACVLCGHSHTDFIDRTYTIPAVGTTRFTINNVPTFDLCIFNWETNTLNLLRIGVGSDRVVKLAGN